MNNICKLSLAAAVALGSLGTLSADFIDSSTISGYTRVDFKNRSLGNDKSEDVTTTSARLELNIKTGLTDTAHSVVRLRFGGKDHRNKTKDETGADGLDDSGIAELKRAYVNFQVPGMEMLSVRVGRSYDSSYDGDVNMLRGTIGTDMGSLSAGFTNYIEGVKSKRLNKDGKEEEYRKGGSRMFFDGSASGMIPGLSANFHYATYSPSANIGAKSDMYAMVGFEVSGIGLTASYLSQDNQVINDGSAMGVQASASMDDISLTGTYFQTDKKGGVTRPYFWSAYNLYSSDVVGDVNDEKTLTQHNVIKYPEASSMSIAASIKLANFNISGTFASNKGKFKDKKPVGKNTEFGGSISTSLAKDLTVKALYGSATEDKNNGIPASSAWKLRAQLSF